MTSRAQPIPDPDRPTHTAIDGETGELLYGVHITPLDKLANLAAPTLAELERNVVHIGWTRGLTDLS
jgi:hypothetical protein